MADKLNAGEQFPALSLQVGDSAINLPDELSSAYTIVLFYRGHW